MTDSAVETETMNSLVKETPDVPIAEPESMDIQVPKKNEQSKTKGSHAGKAVNKKSMMSAPKGSKVKRDRAIGKF